MQDIAQWYTSKRQHVLAGIYGGDNGIADNPEKLNSDYEDGREGRLDVSPKGSLDTPLIPLINYINSLGVVFTTSSCSGRAAVFVDGSKAKTVVNDKEENEPGISYKVGGKGMGGRWLFISHDAEAVSALLDSSQVQAEDSSTSSWIKQLFENAHDENLDILRAKCEILPADGKANTISPEERIVHFKFEPMVLHIQASNFETACFIQRAALSAGFRESGMGSNFLVGVRCASLSLDVPIAVIVQQDANHDIFRLLVSADYMQFLLRSSLQRFSENQRRIDLFHFELKKQFAPSTREDPHTRRERKRAEGLARQAALKQ